MLSEYITSRTVRREMANAMSVGFSEEKSFVSTLVMTMPSHSPYTRDMSPRARRGLGAMMNSQMREAIERPSAARTGRS